MSEENLAMVQLTAASLPFEYLPIYLKAIYIMRFRFCFVVALFIASALGQTFQYSRGWTNGKKRSDPGMNDLILRPRRPTFNNQNSPMDGWSHVRISDQVNEDGDRLLYGTGRCVKMSTSLASAVKDDYKADDDTEFTIN